jgi:hypothetical protein
MRADWLDRLAAELWGHAFCHLDAEPGWTGLDAGRVASAVRRAFTAAIRAIDPEPRSGARYCEFCGSGPHCVVCGRGRP